MTPEQLEQAASDYADSLYPSQGTRFSRAEVAADFIAGYRARDEEVERLNDEIGSLELALAQKAGEIGRAEHRGNTVDYIYDKCANYGRQFDKLLAENNRLKSALEKIWNLAKGDRFDAGLIAEKALTSGGEKT